MIADCTASWASRALLKRGLPTSAVLMMCCRASSRSSSTLSNERWFTRTWGVHMRLFVEGHQPWEPPIGGYWAGPTLGFLSVLLRARSVGFLTCLFLVAPGKTSCVLVFIADIWPNALFPLNNEPGPDREFVLNGVRKLPLNCCALQSGLLNICPAYLSIWITISAISSLY